MGQNNQRGGVESTPDLAKTVTKANKSPEKESLSHIPERNHYSGDTDQTKDSGRLKPTKLGKSKPPSPHNQFRTPNRTQSHPQIGSGAKKGSNSAYEVLLTKLTSNIDHSLSMLSNDPLMSVFREKTTTQEFMMSRLQEILMECIKETNNDYTKKLMSKM
jgi:hypothetical protein